MNNSPWITNIAVGWKCERAKYHFTYKKLKNFKSEANLLSLTLNGVIENSLVNPNGMLPSDISTYQKVKKGDLIFKLIDLENIKTSRVGIAPKDGIMSSVYIRLTTDQNSKYMYYQYYNMYNNHVFNKLGSGVRSTLNYTDLMNMDVLIPNIKKQEEIASFLDDKILKIDIEINNIQKSSQKVQEMQQLEINNLTKSGASRKLKHICEINKETTSCTNDELITYVDVGSVKKNKGIVCQETYLFKDAPSRAQRVANAGDVIISTVRTYLKSSALIDETQANYIYSTAFAILEPKSYVHSEYLHMLVNSTSFENEVSKVSVGMSYPAISVEKLASITVNLPSYDQQVELCKRYYKFSNKCKELLNSNKKKVQLLEEYKKVLINDAVTGKIKIGDEYVK